MKKKMKIQKVVGETTSKVKDHREVIKFFYLFNAFLNAMNILHNVKKT